MIDRRKRKAGQVWNHTTLEQINGVFIPSGRFKIQGLIDKPDGTQDVHLIGYQDLLGMSYGPVEYTFPRKLISTKNNRWQFHSNEGPEFKTSPHVVFCSQCGSSADVVMALVQPTNWVCPYCNIG